MLLQFSFSNFRAFRNQQTLSMAANGRYRTLSDSIFFSKAPTADEGQWLKGALLYGPNASGKSSILLALRQLREMVLGSAKVTDPNESIKQVEPFALAPEDATIPTAFSVAFVSNDIRFEYRVAATRQKIWHESLRAFPKAHEQVWFNRDWDDKRNEYVWSPERPVGFERDQQLESYTLHNVLFLSKAVANNRKELDPVFTWFRTKLRFIDLSAAAGLGKQFTASQLLNNTTLAARIVELLQHADLGVLGATAKVKDPVQFPPELQKLLETLPAQVVKDMRSYRELEPELSHRGFGDREYALPWASESAGTQRLFALAGPWLDILENGLVACVDELETSMHPLMVRELLRLFFSKQHNTKGAQLIATTHNPLLLDPTTLRRDQVWFCDKDDAGAAHLYPLTDYKPREGESLIRGYLAGRYAAVPFIPRGLLGSFDAYETSEVAP